MLQKNVCYRKSMLQKKRLLQKTYATEKRILLKKHATEKRMLLKKACYKKRMLQKNVCSWKKHATRKFMLQKNVCCWKSMLQKNVCYGKTSQISTGKSKSDKITTTPILLKSLVVLLIMSFFSWNFLYGRLCIADNFGYHCIYSLKLENGCWALKAQNTQC